MTKPCPAIWGSGGMLPREILSVYIEIIPLVHSRHSLVILYWH